MRRPDTAAVARQVVLAVVIVMALVLIGSLARGLYVFITRPSREWVTPKNQSTLKLALSVGIAAGALELFQAYIGVRKYCN